MSYWDGANWVLDIRLESDMTATLNVRVTPGRGNEFEVLYGRVLNTGAANRLVTVFIDDGTNLLARLLPNVNIATLLARNFPANMELVDTNLVPAGARFIVSGTMRLVAQGTAFLTTEEMRLTLVARIQGSEPVVTTAVSAGTETVVTATSRVF